MFSLLFAIAALINVNGIRESAYPTIDGSDDYFFDQCVFAKLSKTAISFAKLDKKIQFSLQQSSFLDISAQTDGSAFSINTNVQTNCFLVCISNCASAAQGGAFYYAVCNDCSPSFEYITLNKCKSNNNVFCIIGDKTSQQLLKECNTSCCSVNGEKSDLIMLSDYCTDVLYSTFIQNKLKNSLFSMVNIWGKMEKCNIIDNIDSQNLVSFENSEGKSYTIVSSLFKNNGKSLTFKAVSSVITIDSCFIDDLKTSGSISSFKCITSISSMTAFPATYYATIGCNAMIPFISMTPISRILSPEVEENNSDPISNNDKNTIVIIASTIAAVCVVAAIAAFVIYRKHRQESSSDSYLDVSEISGPDPLLDKEIPDPTKDNMKVIELFPKEVPDQSDPFDLNYEERSQYIY